MDTHQLLFNFAAFLCFYILFSVIFISVLAFCIAKSVYEQGKRRNVEMRALRLSKVA